MNRAIIFCQAPGEMANVLSLYEECLSKGQQIYIICLQIESLKKFLDGLNLTSEVLYFEPTKISLKNPMKWFSKRKTVNENIVKVDFSYSDIYFTTKFDLQLACYMKYFTGESSLFYRRCWDNSAISTETRKGISLSKKIKEKLLSTYTSAKISYVCRANRWCEVINVEKYKIQTSDYIIDPKIFERFSYKLPKINKHSVIFFAEPFQNSFQTKEEYDSLNIRCVEELHKRKYSIYVKGHPRKGSHPDVLNTVEGVIPESVPAEFIDLSQFDFAIDFFSTALCTASFTIPAYSVIGLYNVVDQKTYEYWVKYINDSSLGKVRLLKSFEELPIVNDKLTYIS